MTIDVLILRLNLALLKRNADNVRVPNVFATVGFRLPVLFHPLALQYFIFIKSSTTEKIK